MKKNFLIVMGCAVFLMFSTSAYSAQGAYFTGSLGFAMMNDAGISIEDVDMEGASVDFTSKTGFGIGIGLGHNFGNSMRIEGEFAYQKNDMDELKMSYEGFSASLGLDGDWTSSTFLVNGYYDFSNLSAVTPFLTAGIGYSKVEAEITGVSMPEELMDDEEFDLQLSGSEDDTVLAYQIGAGVGYAVSETLTLDLKYRYFATQDLGFEGVDVEYSNHNFYVGIRLGF